MFGDTLELYTWCTYQFNALEQKTQKSFVKIFLVFPPFNKKSHKNNNKKALLVKQDYEVVSHEFDVFWNIQICSNH